MRTEQSPKSSVPRPFRDVGIGDAHTSETHGLRVLPFVWKRGYRIHSASNGNTPVELTTFVRSDATTSKDTAAVSTGWPIQSKGNQVAIMVIIIVRLAIMIVFVAIMYDSYNNYYNSYDSYAIIVIIIAINAIRVAIIVAIMYYS